MIDPASFKYLYYLKNAEIELIEVKKINQGKNASPEKVYKWLYHHISSHQIIELIFKSMNSSKGTEFREFEKASLIFNEEKGELWFSGKKHILKFISSEEVPSETRKIVDDFYLDNSGKQTLLNIDLF